MNRGRRVSFSWLIVHNVLARARNRLGAVYRGNCHFNNTRAGRGKKRSGETRVHFEWERKLPNLAWLLAIRRI